MSKTFFAFATVFAAMLPCGAGMTPEQTAYHHFFAQIAPHNLRNPNGTARAETGPWYLQNAFVTCPKDPLNRGLLPDEAAVLLAVANVFDLAHEKLIAAAQAAEKATGADQTAFYESGKVALLERTIGNIPPGLAKLVAHHIEITVLPSVVSASGISVANTAAKGVSAAAATESQNVCLTLMCDTSTTYHASGLSASGIYFFTSSVVGGPYYHNYSVYGSVKTPAGRTAALTSAYKAGSGYVDVSLAYDPYDLGAYSDTTQYFGYCTRAFEYFPIGWMLDWFDTLSIHTTFYQKPWPVDGGCAYLATACLPGTTPTCTNGAALDISWPSCPAFSEVSYLVLNGSYCSYVGVAVAATGLGRCN